MMMKGTYPTLEEVLCADLDELTFWDKTLRPPQADAEHTALRRMKNRLVELRAEKRPVSGMDWAQLAKMFEQTFGTGRP